jgi:hypothetical protein
MGFMEIKHLSSGTMAVLDGGRPRTERVSMLRLLWAGPVAVVAAVAATLGALEVAVAILPPIDPAFVELQAQSVTFVTSVLCAAAVAVFSLVTRLSRHPLQAFRVVALVALVLSWVPDLLILSEPGATVGGVIALVLLHVVACVAVVWTLETLTRDA